MVALSDLITQLDGNLKLEKGVIGGYHLLQTSAELDAEGHAEVNAGLAWSDNRKLLLDNLRNAAEALLIDNYPVRPPQFASQHVLDELNRLLEELGLATHEFLPPIEVPVVVGPEIPPLPIVVPL